MNAAAITEVITDLGAQEYHARPALSASGLKLLQRSPAHYWGQMLDPARPERKPTATMAAGTLFHAALFEPDQFAQRYAVKPEGLILATKDGKAWKRAQEAAGREIVTSDDYRTAQAQANAVRADPDLAALLKHGTAEVSAFWTDPETGVQCKCRPDWVHSTDAGAVLVDGKTTTDASPEEFGRSVWRYGYHLQAAWYCDGWEAATGKRVLGFVFAAVESTWPHVAAPYMLGDDVIDKARAINRRLVRLYADGMRFGNWPGYARGVQLINLPKWAQLECDE